MRPDYRNILMDPLAGKLASLLGIEVDEYLELKHSGLRAVKDTDGQVVRYYIVFSATNPPRILRKLDLQRFGMVYFPSSAFDANDLS